MAIDVPSMVGTAYGGFSTLVHEAGFQFPGVKPDSFASWLMSLIAKSNGHDIQEGSMFAWLQWFGATKAVKGMYIGGVSVPLYIYRTLLKWKCDNERQKAEEAGEPPLPEEKIDVLQEFTDILEYILFIFTHEEDLDGALVVLSPSGAPVMPSESEELRLYLSKLRQKSYETVAAKAEQAFERLKTPQIEEIMRFMQSVSPESVSLPSLLPLLTTSLLQAGASVQEAAAVVQGSLRDALGVPSVRTWAAGQLSLSVSELSDKLAEGGQWAGHGLAGLLDSTGQGLGEAAMWTVAVTSEGAAWVGGVNYTKLWIDSRETVDSLSGKFVDSTAHVVDEATELWTNRTHRVHTRRRLSDALGLDAAAVEARVASLKQGTEALKDSLLSGAGLLADGFREGAEILPSYLDSVGVNATAVGETVRASVEAAKEKLASLDAAATVEHAAKQGVAAVGRARDLGKRGVKTALEVGSSWLRWAAGALEDGGDENLRM